MDAADEQGTADPEQPRHPLPLRQAALLNTQCHGFFCGVSDIGRMPTWASALIKIDPGVLSKTDPLTDFLSLDLQYISGMT